MRQLKCLKYITKKVSCFRNKETAVSKVYACTLPGHVKMHFIFTSEFFYFIFLLCFLYDGQKDRKTAYYFKEINKFFYPC